MFLEVCFTGRKDVSANRVITYCGVKSSRNCKSVLSYSNEQKSVYIIRLQQAASDH